MAITPSYPGVYVQEIPSGVRTISGVATSITAFLGRTLRGPVNEPVTINSFGDFERVFGGLWVDGPMSYAVRDFFLNGGGQAIIVRLFKPMVVTDEDKQKALKEASAVAQAARKYPTPQSVVDAAREAVTALANTSSPAKDAANQIVAAAEAAAQAEPAPTAQAVADAARKAVTALATTSEPAKNAANKVAEAAEQEAAKVAPTPSVQSAAAKLVPFGIETEIVETALQAAKEKNATDTTVSKAVEDAIAAIFARYGRAHLSLGGNLMLQAVSQGSWGNNLRARIDDVTDSEVAQKLGLELSELMNLTVLDTATGIVEQFRNVSVKASPRRLDRVLENESRLVRVVNLPDTRPAASDTTLQKIVDGTVEGLDLAQIDEALQVQGDSAEAKKQDRRERAAAELRKPPFESDLRCFSVKQGDRAADSLQLGASAYIGSEAQKTGLYALQKADFFNLLCIPPDTRDGDTQNTVYGAAMSYCARRRAVLIVDPPVHWNPVTKKPDPTELALGGVEARNAALYFPRVVQADPLRGGQLDQFAPCGIVAGVIARTDAERGVWKAPAGIDAALNGIQGLAVSLTDAENGQLNPLGINCLRSFPAVGPVVWGARTMRGADQLADEYKYLPVRRLALYIEESLYRGMQWVVFEPNDEPLWSQVRLNVGAFMHTLFRQGAFQGRTPREAYFVKCDKETTTQDDINRGVVNVVVGFAPLKPAEFVIISIQQIAGQIQS